jgi:hypothetical protein
MVTTRSKSNINAATGNTVNTNIVAQSTTTSTNVKNNSNTTTKINGSNGKNKSGGSADASASRVEASKSTKPVERVVEQRVTRSRSRIQQEQVVQSQSKDDHSQEKKTTRDERRRNEAFIELKTLGKISSLIVSGKRKRKQAEHRDAAFVLASFKQLKDAGEKGGLAVGSRHHYDRTYRNQ